MLNFQIDIHFIYSKTVIQQILTKCMYVPGTKLDAGDIVVSKTKSFPGRDNILDE